MVYIFWVPCGGPGGLGAGWAEGSEMKASRSVRFFICADKADHTHEYSEKVSENHQQCITQVADRGLEGGRVGWSGYGVI